MQNKIIITIGREFGTGGRQIANIIGEMLGIKVYDRKLLEVLKEKYNLTTDDMDRIKGQKPNWWNDFTTIYNQITSFSNKPLNDSAYIPPVTSKLLYEEEKNILIALSEQESCIILGRTGFHIFRNNPNAIRVFLTADIDFRRDKVSKRLNINDGSADLLIKKVDEARENFTNSFSNKSRYDVNNYDIVINVTHLKPEYVAQLIVDFVKHRQD